MLILLEMIVVMIFYFIDYFDLLDFWLSDKPTVTMALGFMPKPGGYKVQVVIRGGYIQLLMVLTISMI